MSDNIRSFLAIEVDKNLLNKINTIEDDFKQIDANIKYVPSKTKHTIAIKKPILINLLPVLNI